MSNERLRYRFLGKSGLKVSELCLGTMTFGWGTSEEESFKILDRFWEVGGNFIDTADVYAGGKSEEIIGKWLKGKPRDQIVLATKVRFNHNLFQGKSCGPNEIGLSRQHILYSVEESLKRLQTDYIDLYQIHAWDEGTPIEETLRTLHQLIQSGKIRYIGCSNLKGWQLQKALDVSKQLNLESFTSLQPQYSLLCRYIEWELVEVCQNEGVGIIPWSPLASGWLTGKYQKGEKPPSDSRLSQSFWKDTWQRFNNDKTWEILQELEKIAVSHKKTVAQVSLNWVLNQPGVTSPIIGTRTLEQLESNLGSVGWSITVEENEKLTSLSQPHVPYPWSMINLVQLNRKRNQISFFYTLTHGFN